MDSQQRIYHGELSPDSIAQALVARFNRNNLRSQQWGGGNQVVVQIASRPGHNSGGDTALNVTIQKVPDGVSIQLSKQAWLGVAASLGWTALSAMRNPLSLLGRLDDIAQDIENLRLSEEVWETVDQVARAVGTGFELSERLQLTVCDYCGVANEIGEPACIACGAPLGAAQPRTCKNCGFIVKSGESVCPNCQRPL